MGEGGKGEGGRGRGGGGRGYFLPEIYDANILSTTAQVHIVLVPAPWPNSAQCDNVVWVGVLSQWFDIHRETVPLCPCFFAKQYRHYVLRRNVLRDKTSHGQNVPRTKRPMDNLMSYRQNIPETKRSTGQTSHKQNALKEKTSF